MTVRYFEEYIFYEGLPRTRNFHQNLATTRAPTTTILSKIGQIVWLIVRCLQYKDSSSMF